MDKITLKQYAELTGQSYGYLRKKMSEIKKAGQSIELEGVASMEKFGSTWMLTIDKRKLKKTS